MDKTILSIRVWVIRYQQDSEGGLEWESSRKSLDRR